MHGGPQSSVSHIRRVVLWQAAILQLRRSILSKEINMNKKFLLLVLALLLMRSPVQAQAPAANDLNSHLIESRAVEAIILAMPAVNTELMLRAMLKSTK